MEDCDFLRVKYREMALKISSSSQCKIAKPKPNETILIWQMPTRESKKKIIVSELLILLYFLTKIKLLPFYLTPELT